jgi:broad specificity phosphatase PhoE
MAGPMSSVTLWLIRHGETEVNRGIWSAKPTESHLTSQGIEQAKKVATALTRQPDLIIFSPLIRTQETADFLLKKWPTTPHQIWPIQEISYLSANRLQTLKPLQRAEEIKGYWEKNDPYYTDGEDAESFATFLQRVEHFNAEILKQKGFVVVIGHEQFLKAYQLGLSHGFLLNSQWMSLFRQEVTNNPIKNGEIFKLCL